MPLSFSTVGYYRIAVIPTLVVLAGCVVSVTAYPRIKLEMASSATSCWLASPTPAAAAAPKTGPSPTPGSIS